jgi:hypothetical protein
VDAIARIVFFRHNSKQFHGSSGCGRVAYETNGYAIECSEVEEARSDDDDDDFLWFRINSAKNIALDFDQPNIGHHYRHHHRRRNPTIWIFQIGDHQLNPQQSQDVSIPPK